MRTSHSFVACVAGLGARALAQSELLDTTVMTVQLPDQTIISTETVDATTMVMPAGTPAITIAPQPIESDVFQTQWTSSWEGPVTVYWGWLFSDLSGPIGSILSGIEGQIASQVPAVISSLAPQFGSSIIISQLDHTQISDVVPSAAATPGSGTPAPAVAPAPVTLAPGTPAPAATSGPNLNDVFNQAQGMLSDIEANGASAIPDLASQLAGLFSQVRPAIAPEVSKFATGVGATAAANIVSQLVARQMASAVNGQAVASQIVPLIQSQLQGAVSDAPAIASQLGGVIQQYAPMVLQLVQEIVSQISPIVQSAAGAAGSLKMRADDDSSNSGSDGDSGDSNSGGGSDGLGGLISGLMGSLGDLGGDSGSGGGGLGGMLGDLGGLGGMLGDLGGLGGLIGMRDIQDLEARQAAVAPAAVSPSALSAGLAPAACPAAVTITSESPLLSDVPQVLSELIWLLSQINSGSATPGSPAQSSVVAELTSIAAAPIIPTPEAPAAVPSIPAVTPGAAVPVGTSPANVSPAPVVGAGATTVNPQEASSASSVINDQFSAIFAVISSALASPNGAAGSQVASIMSVLAPAIQTPAAGEQAGAQLSSVLTALSPMLSSLNPTVAASVVPVALQAAAVPQGTPEVFNGPSTGTGIPGLFLSLYNSVVSLFNGGGSGGGIQLRDNLDLAPFKMLGLGQLDAPADSGFDLGTTIETILVESNSSNPTSGLPTALDTAPARPSSNISLVLSPPGALSSASIATVQEVVTSTLPDGNVTVVTIFETATGSQVVTTETETVTSTLPNGSVVTLTETTTFFEQPSESAAVATGANATASSTLPLNPVTTLQSGVTATASATKTVDPSDIVKFGTNSTSLGASMVCPYGPSAIVDPNQGFVVTEYVTECCQNLCVRQTSVVTPAIPVVTVTLTQDGTTTTTVTKCPYCTLSSGVSTFINTVSKSTTVTVFSPCASVVEPSSTPAVSATGSVIVPSGGFATASAVTHGAPAASASFATTPAQGQVVCSGGSCSSGSPPLAACSGGQCHTVAYSTLQCNGAQCQAATGQDTIAAEPTSHAVTSSASTKTGASAGVSQGGAMQVATTPAVALLALVSALLLI